MIAPNEKAAPIPADVLALARETVAQVHEAEGNHHAAFRVREGYMDNRAPMLVALRLLADQVSQEERIREDERGRLEKLEAALRWYEEHARCGGERGRFAIFRDDCGAKARVALGLQRREAS